MNKT
jgi:PCI domain